MFRVVFEPSTPVLERAKTVHVSARAATVIDFRPACAAVVRMFGTEAEEEIKFLCRMILQRNVSGKSKESDAVALQVDTSAEWRRLSSSVRTSTIDLLHLKRL
jgi:hypothetical protein